MRPPDIVPMLILVPLISLIAWTAGLHLGQNNERERWCEHVHEKHKAVERCQDAPDYEREGGK